MTASMVGEICPVAVHLVPPPLGSGPHRRKVRPTGPDALQNRRFALGPADEARARLRADVLDNELLAHLQAADLAGVARTAGLLERARPAVDSVDQARVLRAAGQLPLPTLADVDALAEAVVEDGPRVERLDFLLRLDDLAAWAAFTHAPHSVFAALWDVVAYLCLEVVRAPWLWLDLVLEARRVMVFSAPLLGDPSRPLWKLLAQLGNDEELEGIAAVHGDPDLSTADAPRPLVYRG